MNLKSEFLGGGVFLSRVRRKSIYDTSKYRNSFAVLALGKKGLKQVAVCFRCLSRPPKQIQGVTLYAR